MVIIRHLMILIVALSIATATAQKLPDMSSLMADEVEYVSRDTLKPPSKEYIYRNYMNLIRSFGTPVSENVIITTTNDKYLSRELKCRHFNNEFREYYSSEGAAVIVEPSHISKLKGIKIIDTDNENTRTDNITAMHVQWDTPAGRPPGACLWQFSTKAFTAIIQMASYGR